MTLSEVHAAVPKELYRKSTWKASLYILRGVSFALLFYKAATFIDALVYPTTRGSGPMYTLAAQLLRCTLWLVYWWWQGVILAGWWCLGDVRSLIRDLNSRAHCVCATGHEAGHGNLSDYGWFNHIVGYTLHTVSSSLSTF